MKHLLEQSTFFKIDGYFHKYNHTLYRETALDGTYLILSFKKKKYFHGSSKKRENEVNTISRKIWEKYMPINERLTREHQRYIGNLFGGGCEKEIFQWK